MTACVAVDAFTRVGILDLDLAIVLSCLLYCPQAVGFPSGIIRYNWNDTEKISMAPTAQGWHAQIEKCINNCDCPQAAWPFTIPAMGLFRLGKLALAGDKDKQEEARPPNKTY